MDYLLSTSYSLPQKTLMAIVEITHTHTHTHTGFGQTLEVEMTGNSRWQLRRHEEAQLHGQGDCLVLFSFD